MSTASHHANSENSHVAHHFQNAEHQYVTAKEGMWAFLCTEILMFGGLFVAYLIYHHAYPETFRWGSQHFLEWKLGAANTVVLLTSSLTMALGIYYVQKRDAKKAVMNLWITLVCGLIFMVIKGFEYSHKFHEGWLPGAWFKPEALQEQIHLGAPANIPLYTSFYFMMSGLHAIHVMVGMGLIFWVLLRTRKGEFGPHYYTPVENVGLFWHLVDLVWIYLFPLLYLVG